MGSDDVRERSEAVTGRHPFTDDELRELLINARHPSSVKAHGSVAWAFARVCEDFLALRAALAVAPATDAKYRAVVRAFDALARGDLRALGTVHEDIQGSVDAIVARLRAAPPAPADARPMVVGGAFVKFDRPTPADDARIYPCADCGLMRSRSEGGTTFTVCDVCWDKAYPTAHAPDAGAADEARRIVPPCPACVSEYGRVDRGCPHCGGTGRCPSAANRDAGAAERAVGEARDVVVRFAVEARNHGTFPVNRDGVIDQTSAVYQSYIATLADLWRSVDAYSAALRGTKGGDRADS